MAEHAAALVFYLKTQKQNLRKERNPSPEIRIQKRQNQGKKCFGFFRKCEETTKQGVSGVWVSRCFMAFFNSAITVLQTLVIALGAGLGIWGAINLLEGYGNDNPGAKSQGMKQLMAGGGVALIGTTLVPLLSGLFG